MSKKKRKRPTHTPEHPVTLYLFLHKGDVQNYEHEGKVGMLVARNQQAAKRLAKKWNATNTRTISPALVGSVQDETLEHHIDASIRCGCKGAWITNDGTRLNWYPYE